MVSDRFKRVDSNAKWRGLWGKNGMASRRESWLQVIVTVKLPIDALPVQSEEFPS